MVKQINAAQYEELIKNGSSVVVLGASWCPDCRRIDPVLDSLAKDFSGKVEIYSISIDSEPNLKDALGVRRIPTLIGYKNGQEVGERLIEPSSKVPIQNLIEQTL
ncbi:thiol reductase thioredoxin [Helicobacter sp. MIT 00-7814]|uniref:thioredoxin family protein n=1 Tax=unclassified Helicobacter TaxID=2593540 RepID=UPI000E1FA617|nr:MULTISPECIES: thioredoxin family protein [unclassified Helicobacter]RDU52827.1 thiol reductase thioredoxin [Helicobacter sp. MIT 00-7814]RDU55984.1 thiol reductase thioredoxin [Helicobacter sp. MIT 99-10781]